MSAPLDGLDTDPTISPLDRELLDLATRLAVEAGDLAIAGRRRGFTEGTIDTKSSVTDLVTEYDRAAEALVVNGITAARPDDGLIGEEGANSDSTTGIDWLIDPIDGTTNFYYDLPGWAVSLGVTDEQAIGSGSSTPPPWANSTERSVGTGHGETGNASA